ncbi:MAG: MgtC/SapB family protein [Leptospiraceae bacterium]|nr:MgtC/SapB family protein [Leptospiraceae bacterium]MDW8305444.1 MgtC/SapB family protein [Leptospiraceae bacterium]
MGNESWGDFLLLFSQFSPRFLAALVAGLLLGLEGELMRRSAGLRTNVLLVLSTCLLTILSQAASQRLGGDPTRIAAQILTGIGFVGAGVIFRHKLHIQGITTAALIFTAAAIGMTIGFGFIWSGIGITILVVLILTALFPIARRLRRLSPLKKK